MVTSIGNVALFVTNLEDSVTFYTTVIGLQVLTTIETDEVSGLSKEGRFGAEPEFRKFAVCDGLPVSPTRAPAYRIGDAHDGVADLVHSTCRFRSRAQKGRSSGKQFRTQPAGIGTVNSKPSLLAISPRGTAYPVRVSSVVSAQVKPPLRQGHSETTVSGSKDQRGAFGS